MSLIIALAIGIIALFAGLTSEENGSLKGALFSFTVSAVAFWYFAFHVYS